MPIDKEYLEKGYKTMMTEIPDEDTYLKNPLNDTLESYLIDDTPVSDDFVLPPPPFLKKYLKYKQKYLNLKNKI
jgi:hypothetical protein